MQFLLGLGQIAIEFIAVSTWPARHRKTNGASSKTKVDFFSIVFVVKLW
jgi:hypothetical protein